MKISQKFRKNLVFIGVLVFWAGIISFPASGSSAGKQKKQTLLTGKLSDIKVLNVRLDSRCRILVELQNKGKLKMAAKEHSQGVVRVIYGKNSEDFFFTKRSAKGKAAVDPGGLLKNPGGKVLYNTKILLKKQERVRAIVTYQKNLLKLKYSGLRVYTLTPRCKTAGPSKTGPGKGVIRKTIKSATLISPNGGEHIEGTCDAIGLRWRYSGEVADMPSTWRVELRRGGSLERSTTVSCDRYTDGSGYRECTATFVHSCVPAGDYKVHISGTDRHGTVISDESDNTFHIGMTEGWGRIVINSPVTGGRYQRGSNLEIKWWSTGPIRPAVAIMRGDSVVLPVPLSGRVSVDSHGVSMKTVRIPDDFAIADDYKVRVTNSNNPANKTETGPFSILEYAPDFSIVDVYVTDRNHLGAQIRLRSEIGDPPFSGPVTFRIDKGIYDRIRGTWSRHSNWNVTVRRITGDTHVDLGDMRASRDFECGIDYMVTIDSPNDYFERDETNNASQPDYLYFRTNYGTIECTAHRHTLGFRVKIRNCGKNNARGTVRMRQVGSWPDPGHLGATRHDVEICNQVVELIPGEARLFTHISHSVSFHSVPGTVSIFFSGDFARWAPSNPVVLRITTRRE